MVVLATVYEVEPGYAREYLFKEMIKVDVEKLPAWPTYKSAYLGTYLCR